MPLNRLKSKTQKEILWVYILKLLKERDMYAYELKPVLMERFGFQPALVTPYVVLYRLEKGGFVEARWDENKKYYKITTKGLELFEEGMEYLSNLIGKLSA
jgi:PadR family transcriptional regulator